METNSKALETFRTYADTELKKHQRELGTHYQDREPASADLMQEAYQKHREVFNQELEEKIQELASENSNLRSSLEKLKEEYVDKLKSSQDSSQ